MRCERTRELAVGRFVGQLRQAPSSGSARRSSMSWSSCSKSCSVEVTSGISASLVGVRSNGMRLSLPVAINAKHGRVDTRSPTWRILRDRRSARCPRGAKSERLARRWFAFIRDGPFERLSRDAPRGRQSSSRGFEPGEVVEGREAVASFIERIVSHSLYEAVTDDYTSLDDERVIIEGRMRWIDEERVIRDDPGGLGDGVPRRARAAIPACPNCARGRDDARRGAKRFGLGVRRAIRRLGIRLRQRIRKRRGGYAADSDPEG